MNNFSETVLWILSLVILVILLWFTYTIVNILVTAYRCRKLDHSLSFCFNTTGKIVYPLAAVIYVVGLIGGIYFMVKGIMSGNNQVFRNALNVAAFVSVVFGYLLSSIVMVGRKNLMVGRMMIDYRKLKKVNYTYNNKMSFVYAQQDYSFSTRFIDKTVLRKAISK